MRQMHALAGASGLYCLGPAARLAGFFRPNVCTPRVQLVAELLRNATRREAAARSTTLFVRQSSADPVEAVEPSMKMPQQWLMR